MWYETSVHCTHQRLPMILCIDFFANTFNRVLFFLPDDPLFRQIPVTWECLQPPVVLPWRLCNLNWWEISGCGETILQIKWRINSCEYSLSQQSSGGCLAIESMENMNATSGKSDSWTEIWKNSQWLGLRPRWVIGISTDVYTLQDHPWAGALWECMVGCTSIWLCVVPAHFRLFCNFCIY